MNASIFLESIRVFSSDVESRKRSDLEYESSISTAGTIQAYSPEHAW
jgi:hypothetical protein